MASMNRTALTLGIVAMAALASARQESPLHPSLPKPAGIMVSGDFDVLKGVKGVYILIGEVEKDERAAGLTPEDLRKAVELPLRRSGIKVFSVPEVQKVRGGPVIVVKVRVIQGAYRIAFDFRENGRLERKPDTLLLNISTWSRDVIGTFDGDPEPIIKQLGKAVDDFCLDYLKANPKK